MGNRWIPNTRRVAGDLAHAAHDCVRDLVESGSGPASGRPRCLLHLWRRKNRRNKNAAGEADLEASIIELSQSERDFINYGMFGALAIFPYLKGTGGVKSPSTFHIIFCTWWICVGLGVLCGNRGRAMLKNILAFILAFYARVSARLAILGVTLLVILYSHLELAPSEIYALYILLGAATCMHLLVWAMKSQLIRPTVVFNELTRNINQ
uniref:Uncharacterized protein n=1 Tax=Oryza punctata TaxID=4537 RepID=A0A0E0JS78_ORYPU